MAPSCAATLAWLSAEPATTESGAVMVASGMDGTSTNAVAVAAQLPALVTVTEYSVAVDCVTVIVWVVSPLDQRYDVNPGPASRTNGSFGQTSDGAVMVTVGADETVTLIGADVAEQPPFVSVTL